MSFKSFKEALQEAEAQELKQKSTPDFEAWLAQQPESEPCHYHPEQIQKVSIDATRKTNADRQPYAWQVVRYQCPECREDGLRKQLAQCDAPDSLLHCAFENWTPANEQEAKQRAEVEKWAKEIRKGFCILLGPYGVGKSHLAVACLREHLTNARRYGASGVFIKQSTLLRDLRNTYKDEKAKDPIRRCQDTEFFVLDEMGLSGGGRDEEPMLHEILDFRYGRKKPTVITSNLPWAELQAEIGLRMADRMREAAYAIIELEGESHRKERRDDYFGIEPVHRPKPQERYSPNI